MLVRLIARQSADISSIVDDLLTITHVEAGTITINPQNLDISKHLQPLVATLAREGNRGVHWPGSGSSGADPTVFAR